MLKNQYCMQGKQTFGFLFVVMYFSKFAVLISIDSMKPLLILHYMNRLCLWTMGGKGFYGTLLIFCYMNPFYIWKMFGKKFYRIAACITLQEPFVPTYLLTFTCGGSQAFPPRPVSRIFVVSSDQALRSAANFSANGSH